RGALRLRLHTHVEPYRRIEAHLLLDQQVRQFVLERIPRSIIRKIAALFSPPHNRIDHAADQLPHRSFPLRCSGLSMEVFAGHDICRCLRPALRHVDAFLLENRYALLIPDQGCALLPFDLVERRSLAIRKIALEYQSAARSDALRRFGRLYRFPVQCRLHRGHPHSSPLRVPVSERGTLIFYSSAVQRYWS